MCFSPPMMKAPVFPGIPDTPPANFIPHPALILPNVLPFMATHQHQNEAHLMAAMMRQKILNSFAAMNSMMAPRIVNPFLLPFMGGQTLRPPPPLPQMRPTHNIPKHVMVPTLNPRAPVVNPKPSQTLPYNRSRTPSSAEKLETVNGGFGIKNPLAKNPAIQDHLLQTMGECLINNFIWSV